MLRRALSLSSVLLLLALLLGCHTVAKLDPFKAGPPPPDMAKVLAQAKLDLQNASPCCNSYADFSYQTRLPWQPARFELGPNSPVANLNGSRTHFLTFSLPSGPSLPYDIAFKAEINGRWVHSSYLFAPTFTVLDAAFQPISNSDVNLCESLGWSEETSGAFASLTINSDKARYLVVYSSAAQLSSNTYWEQSAATQSNANGLLTGMGDSNSAMQVQHGPDGVIWVGIMSNSYRRALKQAICGKPKPGNGMLNGLTNNLEFWHRPSNDPAAASSSAPAPASSTH